MKTKIFIVVLALGLFSRSTILAQEKEKSKIHQEHVNKEKYTCPMHPEFKSNKPGNCSICGMDLVKVKNEKEKVKTEYTCPMHPEGVSDKPGKCSECGMDLKEKKGKEMDKSVKHKKHKHCC